MTDKEKLNEIQDELDKLHLKQKKLKEKLNPVADRIRYLIIEKGKLLRKVLVGKYIHQIQILNEGFYRDNYIHVLSSDDGNKAIVEKISLLYKPTTGGEHEVIGFAFFKKEEVDLFLIDTKSIGGENIEITKEKYLAKKEQAIREIT